MRTKILVTGLLLTLTACGAANRQTLGEVLPTLKNEVFNEVKHTASCNSLAPLAVINHYYNDDVTAVTAFVNELLATKVQRYKKLPENKNVACPTINTYVFTNERTTFTFDVTNMFVVKDNIYYELEELPSITPTRTTHSFSRSTMIVATRDLVGKEVTDFSLSLSDLEFRELTEFSENIVNFTLETHGGIISVYDEVTFGLDVGEHTARFYEVISDTNFATLFQIATRDLALLYSQSTNILGTHEYYINSYSEYLENDAFLNLDAVFFETHLLYIYIFKNNVRGHELYELKQYIVHENTLFITMPERRDRLNLDAEGEYLLAFAVKKTFYALFDEIEIAGITRVSED